MTLKPLLPRCWDPEDFKDTWKKQNALPWQSHKVGRPTRNGDGGAVTWGPRAGTAVSSTPRHAFTCSWGTIKVWSPVCQVVEDRFPERCLPVQVRAGLWAQQEPLQGRKPVSLPTLDLGGVPSLQPAVLRQQDPPVRQPWPGWRERVGPGSAFPACER